MPVYTSAGTENLMRWDRQTRGFMEVWYATITHRATGTGLWVRYTITSPLHGDPRCAVWGFAFDRTAGPVFAAKQGYPIDALGPPSGRDDGALLRIGDCWVSETHLDGAVSTGEATMSWSLDMEPSTRTFQHLPEPVRRVAERRVSTLCSPNPSVPFSGVVAIGGRELEIDGDLGTQTHRWGRGHARDWAWVHCDVFDESVDASLEGVAATTDLGPLRGPTLTFLHLRYRGEDIAFNEMRTALRARSRYEMPQWAFSASTKEWKIAGAARARIERMVQLRYEDPDGSLRYCCNSEVADVALELYRRTPTGWAHEASLSARSTGHLEFGRREVFEALPVAF